ncbi:hypothetical protein B0H11DRAFT_2107362 [Mycena galericulata]|nr:hypothetical protein B0H11DRAFT_2115974 [Mycena galericulata]KAJ7437491.1 hypothetical protein B0H11DRAFT_2107362 [Mycena galericulata]
MTDRSTSRGRDALTSSGRGGVGNMQRSSESRDRPLDGPDDFSSTRGREPAVVITEVRSTGRGGSGNFRSPSRDVVEDRDVRSPSELERIRAHEAREKEAMFSTGRGGAGNMSRSPSQGPASPPLGPSGTNSREQAQVHPQVHSSGRGGAGNIVPGPAPPYERGRVPAIEGIHSTGRGGLANLTASPSPPVDLPVHHHGAVESTGRGGAGNMSRSRERTSESASRERGSASRERSKERGGGGIAGLWNRMHPHPHPHAPHAQPETIPEGEAGHPVGAAGGAGVGVGGRAGAI